MLWGVKSGSCKAPWRCRCGETFVAGPTGRDGRLALRVNDAFLNGLDQLTQAEGSSRAEIVRRAVALYAFAKQEESQGRRLGFFTEEGGRQVVKEVIAL